MTTTFFLVRHAAHDRVGTILCGRMPGVTLGAVGHGQAQRVAERLGGEGLSAVCTSPLERSTETASPIASRAACPLREDDALLEIDFGAWTGRAFADLEGEADWRRWNTARADARPPGGESMGEAQARIVGAMAALRRAHAGKPVAVVSHGDVIKAALLHHLGLPLDAYTRIEVEPASISTLVVGDWGAKLIRLNEVVPA